jgi:hypothetical protein
VAILAPAEKSYLQGINVAGIAQISIAIWKRVGYFLKCFYKIISMPGIRC